MNYGYEFETKLLSALTNDTQFLIQIGDILKESYFQSDAGKWLIRTTLNHYKEFNQAPTLLVFKTEIERLDPNLKLLKDQIIAFLKDSYVNSKSTDLEYVKQTAVKFCRDEEMKIAILESVEHLKVGNYDLIRSRIDAASKVGLTNSIGHNYKEEVQERYMLNIRKTIPTFWPVLDDITQGGAREGELSVIIAPGGVGKSWVLAYIGCKAIQAGYNVIHYTLELNKYYVGKRYDSILSGIPSANLPLYQDNIVDMVSQVKGNLLIEEYPTKTASVTTLKSHIDRAITAGIAPDLIIVDYGALLKGDNPTRYLEVGEIYEELRGLAGEYKVPVWTAAQARREAIEKDIIKADDVAEAYSIIAVSDFVMSLARKTEDSLAGTGRFFVIKNRNGIDQITFPARFNASNGAIDIFSPATAGAAQVRKDMSKGDELLRKELGRKYFDEFLQKENMLSGSAQ